MGDNDAREVPMVDHVARFIRELGDADGVRIDRLNALRHYDTSNYGPAVPKAVASEYGRLQSRIDVLVKALEMLVSDVAGYPAWARPCHALDIARAAAEGEKK